MRSCPVCELPDRTEVFRMSYLIPDGWTLPSEIVWYACDTCGMIYADGEFSQADFDTYYRERYGYGVNNPDNIQRLKNDAVTIHYAAANKSASIVDFGGAGDDGRSVLVEGLNWYGFVNAVCVGPNDPLPQSCDVIYASHVIEHIYDLPATMERIAAALADDGLLIIDVPDATGLLLKWKMPILDYNTKHLNHFTLRNLLDLGRYHGFEAVHVKPYELEGAPAYQVHFRQLDVAEESRRHIQSGIAARVGKLYGIKETVNIWGLGDITWHLLSMVNLDVLDYIDNDPAFRGQTYNGKPVQERPTNDAPIVILSQGQRKRLIANIRAAGIENRIIEI